MIISLQNSLTKTKRVLFVQHSHRIYWHAKRTYEIINAQSEEKINNFNSTMRRKYSSKPFVSHDDNNEHYNAINAQIIQSQPYISYVMSQFSVLLSHLMLISLSFSCCFIIESICLHLKKKIANDFHKTEGKTHVNAVPCDSAATF